MMTPYLSDTVICFDLDDTLYKEIDYLKSAYIAVAKFVGHPEAVPLMMDWYYSGENVFEKMIDSYGLSVSVKDCLQLYRNHQPNLSLGKGIKDKLLALKEKGAKLGIITDGRSNTQRAKINALELNDVFDVVIISEESGSEKPGMGNFLAVMNHYPTRDSFMYVGDNPAKDFFAPNELGWITYCVKDDGRNIHKQDFSLPLEYLPKYTIDSIEDFFV